jgi:hypothetical protein
MPSCIANNQSECMGNRYPELVNRKKVSCINITTQNCSCNFKKCEELELFWNFSLIMLTAQILRLSYVPFNGILLNERRFENADDLKINAISFLSPKTMAQSNYRNRRKPIRKSEASCRQESCKKSS